MTKTIDMTNIPKLRELLKGTAELPWKTGGVHNGISSPTGNWDGSFNVITKTVYNPRNADLIVSAINALPEMLDRLEYLEVRLKSYEIPKGEINV